MKTLDPLASFLLLTLILLITEIFRVVREIEELGGPITAQELHLTAQRIGRDIRDFLYGKS
jgi:hypothetical protein